MIIFDNIKKKYVIVTNNNDDKNYYNNIIYRKYNLNINNSKINVDKLIKNKINKLY